jgi:hypothetical protein
MEEDVIRGDYKELPEIIGFVNDYFSKMVSGDTFKHLSLDNSLPSSTVPN